jgi:hypothetical protein
MATAEYWNIFARAKDIVMSKAFVSPSRGMVKKPIATP